MRASFVLVIILTFLAFGAAQEPPEVQEHPESLEPPESVVALGFTGDLMAHNATVSMKDYSAIYSRLTDDLKSLDFVFANLETVVDDHLPTSAYPLFNVHTNYVEAAIQAGVNVFSLANNHSNDKKERGMLHTLEALESLAKTYRVSFSGLRRANSPWALEILNKNGINIGFLAVTRLVNERSSSAVLNYVPDEEVLTLIRRLRPTVDLLVLSVHSGVEYEPEPSSELFAFDRKCLEAGADIFWGHHPHVLQPWYLSGSGDELKIIMPSMGNFVSGQTRYLSPTDGDSDRARTGDALLLTVEVHKVGDRVFLAQPKALPLNTLTLPNQGTFIAPTDTWVRDAPKAWRPYFLARQKYQKQFLTPRVLEPVP